MFQWSKKVVKSVTFNPGVADESLLALVESQLEKDPDKSFSDVCKDALWQSLCVPESVRPAAAKTGSTPIPTPTPAPLTGAVDQQVIQLQRQIADLEERFFARESNRLEIMESQLMQLSQQVAQLALMVTQGVMVQVAPMHPVSSPDGFNRATPVAAGTFTQEVDPVISRLSQLVDDF
jgi:hypothetical protein